MRFVQPEVVISHFHIREGDKVADFGAGSGYFLKTLSAAVGEEGLVYACVIQKKMVETLDAVATKENLTNVRSVWCDFEKVGGSKLEDGSVDVVLLVNTFFQVENHATVIEEMKRVLRPGGKAVVIDWTESFGGLGPQPSDVVEQKEAERLFNENGFTTETSFDAGDHHYGVIFRK